MPPKTVYILNPAAGRGTAELKLSKLLASEPAQKIFKTTMPGDAMTFARQAAQDGAEIVVACGGDGTISEVATGLYGSAAKLAVVPLGTGNDFARTLGIFGEPNLALQAIDSGTPVPLDLIRWKTHEREGLCVNIAGCGFDAAVADRINHGFRGLTGVTAYIAGVLYTLATYKPVELSLMVDGESIQTSAMLCAVANAQTYGGGMKVAPNADFSDGLMDLVVVKSISRLGFLRAFPSVFSGTHLRHPKVVTRRARVIHIESSLPALALADGEIVGTTPLEFEIIPKALSVMQRTHV